jgi:hypothetical protein
MGAPEFRIGDRRTPEDKKGFELTHGGESIRSVVVY